MYSFLSFTAAVLVSELVLRHHPQGLIYAVWEISRAREILVLYQYPKIFDKKPVAEVWDWVTFNLPPPFGQETFGVAVSRIVQDIISPSWI